MVYSGTESYAYLMIEGTKGSADPSSDALIPLNPMTSLTPQKPKYVDEEIRTFDSLVPKVVYTKEKAPGEGPLESFFVDPFILLTFFTHKTVGGTWVTGTGTITADFTDDDDEDTLGLQYHGHDQSASVAHIEKLLKYGLPQKYGWKIEPGFLLKEVAEVKFLDFETNTQAMSLSNAFHDQAFGLAVGGWANWDKSGLGAVAEIFTVLVTKTAAQITTGWYFTFTDGTTSYYVWMDKNGDGSTDDPSPGSGTGVSCNISGATTAADVAVIIAAAINALSISSATVSTVTVTVTNDHLGNVTDAADVNTTFTITTTQQGVTSGFRSVADMVLKWGGLN